MRVRKLLLNHEFRTSVKNTSEVGRQLAELLGRWRNYLLTSPRRSPSRLPAPEAAGFGGQVGPPGQWLSEKCGTCVNLSLFFFSFLFVFLFLEIIFRLPFVQEKTGGNWPEIARWLKEINKNREINSLGFRDGEHKISQDGNNYRILVLGDSYVYGQSVDYEDIFPNLLEKKLNELYPERKFEVIKMGLCGWNTVEELKALKEKGILHKPDLIIIGFSLNDPQVKNHPTRKEAPELEKELLFLDAGYKLIPFLKKETYEKRFLTFLNNNSYFYSFLKYSYNRFLEKNGWKQDYATWQRNLYIRSEKTPIGLRLIGDDSTKMAMRQKDWDQKQSFLARIDGNPALLVRGGRHNQNVRGWRDFENSLKEIKSISRKNNAEVLFVSLNFYPGWEKESKMAREVAEKYSLDTLDLFPFFKDYNLKELQVSPSDGHPNAFAHKIYAEEIAKFILQKYLNF